MYLRKRIFSILAGILAICASLPFVGMKAEVKGEEKMTPIDIYLIGGQSNAVGASVTHGQFSETFANVGYAGETERNRTTGSTSSYFMTYKTFQWGVTQGLGFNRECIGPEYGIAKYVNNIYAGKRKAFIFKSAGGGTSLRNIAHAYGNWLPPSKWPTDYQADGTDSMGYQYQMFLNNFQSVYTALTENGYQPNVMGMAWMQGEADLMFAAQYKPLLKLLIEDLREDIFKITGAEKDKKMPFVIGEIAYILSPDSKPVVRAFNNMQREVAEEMENAYTVKTSDLPLYDENGVLYGDGSHFRASDMEILGLRFGEKLAKSRVEEYYAELEQEKNGDKEENAGCGGVVATGVSAVTIGFATMLAAKKTDGTDRAQSRAKKEKR